ncbi:hypothetical protein GJAV_G00090780 [Gymnothorax javanicus]|nr:hypothetical protein GJAV_G00090780 [Gymnothorax javanicus]
MYLHLACEELRSYAVFEKMKASLQSLPQLIGPLIQHILLRLQSQHRGLGWALSALTVSKRGLRERELYAILSMCSGLSPERGEVTWQELMELARKPQERIPLATFSQLFRSLQSLIGQSYTQGPEDCLSLTNPEVRSAFEGLFLSGAGDKARAHRLLAAHLWTLSDPLGKDTFYHCEADAIIHLPAHLMGSGQTAAVSFLLSSFHFLYANVRHGFLHHLLEIYSQFESLNSVPSDAAYLEECRGFLKRHAPLLSHWPALFLQQALNEPDGTAPHTWARGIVGDRGRAGLMRWLNKPKHVQSGDSELVSSYLSKPTCVAVSPGVTMAAVGTENGSLHLILRETGKEVRSLVSCCDGISSCCFLGEGLLASTSFDGQLELWDVDSGCRTLQVDAHTNRITGCDVSTDRKHLATVSLDFNLKIWSQKGTLVATEPHPCPLNCVTFDPEGQVLAAGGWDGGVHLWNWLRGERLGILSGHRQSVRSVSFSPSASLLSSGALSGEVRLWAVPARSCVGCYHAHSGSTEVLNFVQKGELLLSAGADGVVQVWSGGLGQETAVLGVDQNQPDSRRLATAGPPALCVAVSGCLAAVGYHGDGVKLYGTESGEKLWNSTDLRQSVRCLLWIQTATPTGSGEGPGEQTEVGAETGDQMEVESPKEAGTGVLEVESREGLESTKEVGPAEVMEAESTAGSESEEGAESKNEAGSEEVMGAESTEGSESKGSGSEKEAGSEEEMGAGSPEGSESGEGWETEKEEGSEQEMGVVSSEGSESGEGSESEKEAEPEEENGAGSPEGSESGEGSESEKEAGPEEQKGAGSPEGSESGEGSESEKEAEPEEERGAGSAAGSESAEVMQAESAEGSESSEGEKSGEGAESEKDAEGQESEEAEFLVTGSEDSRLRVWRRQEEEQVMELLGCFGVQQGPILALAQSSTLLASASEDGTIVLWSLQELTSDPWQKPSPKWVLREHSGGVTCLSFSPCGKGLISGGKDRVLCLWWLPPPSLSRTLRHCHRDWITGCAWTADSTVVTCSSDGRVCVWNMQLGSCIKEIPTPLSLTSVCSVGEHVIGTSREGDLLLWEWQSGVEVSRIPAHRAPIQHCSILPHKGKENLVVTTASDDGTVKLWRPYNVQHHSTITGHSGGIRGLAVKQEGVPVFLTVSEDCSLRSCSVSMAMETAQQGATQALVFSPCGSLLVCGFASGRVQVWNHTSVLCTKKVSDSEVTALAWMPDSQLAVGCADCSVSVWKLDWNLPQPTARLHKVSSCTVDCPVRLLCYCSILLGVCEDGFILNAGKKERDYNDTAYQWRNDVRVLALEANDEISTWLLGDRVGSVNLGFLFSMGPCTNLASSFCHAVMDEEKDSELVETKSSEPVITAIAKDGDFLVCGDSKGQIWFNQPPNLCSWSEKKRAHSGRISALRLTESTIISASYDRSVKLWDRNGKRQVGAFVCGAPVLSLAVNPVRPTQLVCGDALGGVYFLSWRD